MITLIVNIKVKEGSVAAWKTATLANVAESRKESGILAFDFLADREDATRFTFVEKYRDDAAMAAHKKTEHYARWSEIAEPLQAEPRTRAFYTSLEPGTSA